MKKILLLFLVLTTGLVLAACTDAATDPSSVNDSGRIEPLESTSFNWGDINIAGGKVDHTFKFKNAGDKDLIIKTAQTSCMCTTAVIETKDTKSPEFGMHEVVKWGYAIKPGEEFSMKVTFDPLAHGPQGTGPIDRAIYILSSSTANGQYAKFDAQADAAITEIKASANVLSESAFALKSEKTEPQTQS